MASLAIGSARHLNLSCPAVSGQPENTTSESTQMDRDMGKESIVGQMAESMLELL